METAAKDDGRKASEGCSRCIRRRSFLAGLTGLASIGGAALLALGRERALGEAPPSKEKTRIRLVFSHHRQDEGGKQSEPGWPFLGYDHEKTKKDILEKLKAACPDFEFLPSTAYDTNDAKKVLDEDARAPADGYLAYMIGGWAGAAGAIAEAGKPTVFAGDFLGASGEILVAYAAAKRKGLKVVSVSSSRFEDVADALRPFGCFKKMRSSAILVVGGDPGPSGKAIEELFGTKVLPISFKEINDDYEKADRARAREWADLWMREAQKVVEPAREEIEKSAAMYLALRSLLERHKADAITMNCLGGVYSGQTHAYPCLGFFQLNSDGGVGACEADIESTLSMLVMKHLTGTPGYISDPVLDTAQKRIVYVHCVAPNRVFGPKGRTNPYEIRSHAEDRRGAAVRSLMPLGEMTTTLRISPTRREVIFHQAKTVANIDDPKSCRSKLAAEVKGDMEKLESEWDQWGWHRVTFYGDHKRAVKSFCALSGFRLVEEA